MPEDLKQNITDLANSSDMNKRLEVIFFFLFAVVTSIFVVYIITIPCFHSSWTQFGCLAEEKVLLIRNLLDVWVITRNKDFLVTTFHTKIRKVIWVPWLQYILNDLNVSTLQFFRSFQQNDTYVTFFF